MAVRICVHLSHRSRSLSRRLFRLLYYFNLTCLCVIGAWFMFCCPEAHQSTKNQDSNSKNIFVEIADNIMSSGKSLGSSMGNKSQSIHENLMRESKDDVFKKYETLEILGQGSMVSVQDAIYFRRIQSSHRSPWLVTNTAWLLIYSTGLRFEGQNQKRYGGRICIPG